MNSMTGWPNDLLSFELRGNRIIIEEQIDYVITKRSMILKLGENNGIYMNGRLYKNVPYNTINYNAIELDEEEP